jgi:hypothetical protein
MGHSERAIMDAQLDQIRTGQTCQTRADLAGCTEADGNVESFAIRSVRA